MVMTWTDQGVNTGTNIVINCTVAAIANSKKGSCTRFDMDNTIGRCALNPSVMGLCVLSMSMIRGLNAAVRFTR